MLFVLAAGTARSEDAPEALTNFAAAQIVIGQKNFKSSDCNQGKKTPAKGTVCDTEGAVAWRKNVFYVPDGGNNRVLGFKAIPTKNGASATFILGQSNFTKSKAGVSRKALGYPTEIVVVGNKLLLNDGDNNRVLIWNKLPTNTNAAANVVVGQPNFTSNNSATTQSGLNEPELGLFVANDQLFVSDGSNNRVMIWNSIPTTNGADADVVVGQSDFTSFDGSDTQTGLFRPEGLWSDGTRLIVVDRGNNRVLIWNSIPTSNDAPADVVVGQLDFTTLQDPAPPSAQKLDSPTGVASDGTSLYVADEGNNRILVFDPFPTSNNPAASIVLGQADFTHGVRNAGNTSPSAQTLNQPWGLSLIGTRLIVNDFGNNRYLIFRTE
jgi:hypothetical protein